MAEKGRTKDETFVLRLYEEACKQEEQDDPLDRYAIGHLAGLQKTAVDTICNLLAQANFIKKQGPIHISITPHGARLAERIKEGK